MATKKSRVSLREHAEEIRRWVREGRDDGWIAGALGTSAASIQSFRSRNEIFRRHAPEQRERTAQEGPVSAFEGVLDHGEQEGWGLWFDPSVAEDPIWRESWRDVEAVRVRVSRNAIVLEPQERVDSSSGEEVSLRAGDDLIAGADAALERGSIKWFDSEKGYGFVTRPTGEDLFVHVSEVEPDPHELAPGQEVLYEVGEGDRGPLARDLSLPDED